jgi:predicted dehydrogenase
LLDNARQTRPLRVGIVGFGWMGQVHARAYARLRQHYPNSPLAPVLVAVADNAPDTRLADAVAAYGFSGMHTDWPELVARDDLDLISVTGPNFLHRDVAVAAAQAGMHVWVEKPAGRNAGETRQIRDAVRAAGVHSAAGFNYRNAPAVEQARQLIRDGRLGAIEHVTIRLLADYAAHPDAGLTWRFRNEWAGSGVLGDLVSHGLDLARYLVGEISELVGDRATFLSSRPLVGAAVDRSARVSGGARGDVENEDYVSVLLRFASGARGVLESSRVAVGEQCRYEIEVHGERGALAWDFRRLGELRVALDQDFNDAAYATLFCGPGVGELGAFQPGPGIAMGFDDLKVIELHRLVTSITTGQSVGATIDDAVRAAELVDAIADSADRRAWVPV